MNFKYLLIIFFFIPSTFALQDTLFEGNSNIETVFDAATGFMIPLIIYLSLNHGMNIYLFCSFIILAIADMGLTILFTYFCYFRYNKDPFFWIYFIFIESIYIINYFLILKESNYFNKSFLELKSENTKRILMVKFIKKKLIPLTLYIINFIFLGIAIHKNYVDFINGLFIIIPSIILFIVYFGFIIFYDENSNNKKRNKSNGLAHLRFLVEFMCSIIFVMISGPSVLWIKCYLSITIVEMSLYLERAKPKKSVKSKLRYRIDNLDQYKDLLLMNFNNNNDNDNEKSKDYVIELHIKERVKEENDDIQLLSLKVVDV
jgi:hypothetical protein